ncbi:MAG: succinyl-diaminopimelate desuccinylase, partial [Pseudomonadota bacterium]
MAAPAPIDPAALTAALVRRPSVTPEDAGCLDLLAETLAPFGFAAHACDRGAIKNRVFEWRGAPGGPVLGFNGHTDVVPVGDRAAWSVDPFSGLSRDGAIWGRGAVDMKSGVAAFAAAATAAALDPPAGLGGLALMITGDEEGDGVDGTRAILDWMRAEGRRVDHCVVGEPTSAETFGDVMKIGRRGSVTFDFAAVGRQGHTAYPDRAANPLPALARLLDRLASAELDPGTAHFQPSTLALTTIDVG